MYSRVQKSSLYTAYKNVCHVITLIRVQVYKKKLLFKFRKRHIEACQRADDFATLIADKSASATERMVDYRQEYGGKLLHEWKNIAIRSEFLGFYLYLCIVLSRFLLDFHSQH